MSFIGARLAIKTLDGKFVSFDENNCLKLKECSNDLDPEIIFYCPLAVSNVFVQAHNREFVSVNVNNEISSVPCSHQLSETEAFNFICLGMNRVAIQAHNGKFLSVATNKNGNGRLTADSDGITQDETFEVILVFR
jgi:hypothetical protein